MAELRDLVTRARTGHLHALDVGSATFTVTQLGENEVEDVTPIIHPPQVAILGLGAPHREPWAVDDMLAVRPVVHASLAADHGAIDGRIGSLLPHRSAAPSPGGRLMNTPLTPHALIEAALRRVAPDVDPAEASMPTCTNDLGLDSMDLLSLAAAISADSGIEIPEQAASGPAHPAPAGGLPGPAAGPQPTGHT